MPRSGPVRNGLFVRAREAGLWTFERFYGTYWAPVPIRHKMLMTGAELQKAMIVLGQMWGWDRAPCATELGRALKCPAKDPGEAIRNALHRRDEPLNWMLAGQIEMCLRGALPPGGIPERLYDKTARKPRKRAQRERLAA